MSFSSNNNQFRITLEGDATKFTAVFLTEALLQMLAQVQESQQGKAHSETNSVSDTDGERIADRLPRLKTRQNQPKVNEVEKVKKVKKVMKKKSVSRGKKVSRQLLRKCKSCQTTKNYYAKGFCKPCYRDDYYGRKRQEKVSEAQHKFDTSLLFSPQKQSKSSKMGQFKPNSSTDHLMFSQVDFSIEPSPPMSDQYVEPNPSLRF